MIRHNIPTAKYKEYINLDEAINEIDSFGYPVVIKADGLAAGKGVVIPENREDAIAALKEMMSDKKFGSAGEKIVVEEFLSGTETSILAFVDNDTIVPMVSAKDHKKVYNFEKGPNTGGMGTFSPSEIYTDALSKEYREFLDAFIPELKSFLMKEGVFENCGKARAVHTSGNTVFKTQSFNVARKNFTS